MEIPINLIHEGDTIYYIKYVLILHLAEQNNERFTGILR